MNSNKNENGVVARSVFLPATTPVKIQKYAVNYEILVFSSVHPILFQKRSPDVEMMTSGDLFLLFFLCGLFRLRYSLPPYLLQCIRCSSDVSIPQAVRGCMQLCVPEPLWDKPSNGVLVNPDRFLPFSAFPNMYIVFIFPKNRLPSVAPQRFSMSTPKSVNPRRSYAGLRGLLWVVLFLIILLYMVPLFFAS